MSTSDYHIWIEGCDLGGKMQFKARLVAIVWGTSLSEACLMHAMDNARWDVMYDHDALTHCGRKLFDNEADARRSHG